VRKKKSLLVRVCWCTKKQSAGAQRNLNKNQFKIEEYADAQRNDSGSNFNKILFLFLTLEYKEA